MVAEAIQKQVLALTKLEPKDGEDADAFSRRVAKRVHDLADKDAQNWEALSEDAQAWVNEVGIAAADATIDALSVPEGEPAEDPAPEEEASAEEPAEASEEETSVVAEKSVKKAVAKKKAAPKEPKAKPAAKAKVEPKAAKPAKEPKAKPVAKAKANGTGTRGRKPAFGRDAKIKLLAKENPHRPGTKCFKMFAKYKDGMTIGDVIKAGVPYTNVRYLSGLGHIKLVG
jgi:hypothetical protein